MEQKRIVFLGITGCGKTSLYNRITNSSENVFSGSSSQQLIVFQKQSAFEKTPFTVIDPPGLCQSKFKFKKAAMIVAALTSKPVNRIMIVVKLNRTDVMLTDIRNALAPVSRYRYRSMITIILTHWDLVNKYDDKYLKNIVNETLKKFNINSIIFTSKDDDGKTICEKIHKEINNTDLQQISFEPGQIASSFDLIEYSDEEMELTFFFIKSELLSLIRLKMKKVIQFIEKYPVDSPQLEEVMHLITIEAKKIAKECIKKVENANLDLFQRSFSSDKIQPSLLHMELKKEIKPDLEYTWQTSQEKLFSSQHHFSKKMRVCPNCDKPWLIEEKQPYFKCWCDFNLQIDIVNDKIEVKKANSNIQQKEQKNQIGCGKTIKYEKMLKLSQEQLKELMDPEILEFMCNDGEVDELLEKAKIELDQEMPHEVNQQIKLLKL